MSDAQAQLDIAIDMVLDTLLTNPDADLDPLATILERMKARGEELDLSGAPPLVQMLLSGALG